MFAHLHVHTHFSFGIGASSPEMLAQAAAKREFRALACTDTNGVYGAVEFQRACEAAGVRPILGAHLVTDDEETIALATDERGWAALCRMITRIHWKDGKDREGGKDGEDGADGYNGYSGAQVGLPKSEVRAGMLAEAGAQGDGWSGSQARPDGAGMSARAERTTGRPACAKLSNHLANDRDGLILLSSDTAFLHRLLEHSGPRDLYAELRPGKERHAILAESRRLGLPAVVTAGAVMAHPEDWSRHRLLRA